MDNTLVLTYDESRVPVNLTLSGIRLQEAFAKLNSSHVLVGSNLRTGVLSVEAWNSGDSAATFTPNIICESGWYFLFASLGRN